MKIKTKDDRRERIKYRIRKRVQGSEARPRLTVFRSVAHMYVQVVDDMTGRTIASASTVEPTVKGAMKTAERGGNIAGAKAIGKTIAERLIEKGGTPRPLIRVFLKYGPHGEKVISGIERISRPGRRVYLGVDDVPAVLGGLGTNILTTSRGVMTGRAARKAGVGGEVLCNVW